MTNDDSSARLAFTTARIEQAKITQAQPNYGPALSMLGLIDAGLGRTEEALREGRRAVELAPVGKDAMTGPIMVEYLAMIAAWVGNKDLAWGQLAVASRAPGGVSYGQLKLMPWWDPLRGDPRFEESLIPLHQDNPFIFQPPGKLNLDKFSADSLFRNEARVPYRRPNGNR